MPMLGRFDLPCVTSYLASCGYLKAGGEGWMMLKLPGKESQVLGRNFLLLLERRVGMLGLG